MRTPTHLVRRSGAHRPDVAGMCYCLRDRLHEGRAVEVPGEKIAAVVAAWLAELGAASPLVQDLARAVCTGDWPSAHALAECLSVEVAVAA